MCRQTAPSRSFIDRLVVEPAPPPSPIFQEIFDHETSHETPEDAQEPEGAQLNATDGKYLYTHHQWRKSLNSFDVGISKQAQWQWLQTS